ncbi:MAG TPA: 4-alpha-glucanotransferase, partial [Actinomycetota bacterium]|nr:4-alpha-glucanotransferase [Actinomycetota bacterium]
MPGPNLDPERLTLATLAELWGVQASYRDVEGNLQRGSRDAVLAVLAALGAPVPASGAGPGEIADAIAARRRQLWERPVEPVIVAWDGYLHSLAVRLPEGSAPAAGELRLRLEREDGSAESWTPQAAPLMDAQVDLDGRRFVQLRLLLGRTVPIGYHRLVLEEANAGALVIAAPRRAVAAPHALWGVFCPLYSLHADRETALGIGDVADLKSVLSWVEGLGGALVATLPLLPTFLDGSLFQPSPYSPVSRMFWNEIYIDLGAVPEVAESPAARQALTEARQQLASSGALSGRLVDYRQVEAAKRRVLAAAAARLLEGGSERQEALRAFAAGHPDLEAYAAFRAACEHY